MKILLAGSNSFIGNELLKHLDNHEVLATYNKNKNPWFENQVNMDITNKEEVEEIIKNNPADALIIVSAIPTTYAPEEKIQAVNVSGVRNLVDAIGKYSRKSKIVFFSTDQVFDGKKGLPKEEDEPNPKTAYGKSKAKGEEMVKKHGNWLILRCSLVLGWKKPTQNTFISMFAESKEKLKIFKDRLMTPIYVKDVGKIVAKLLEDDVKGIVNIGGNEILSYLEIAERIEKIFNIKKHYDIAETTDNVPKKTGLDNAKLKSLIDFELTNLDDMLIEIKNKAGEIA